jgi:hypothetical protein
MIALVHRDTFNWTTFGYMEAKAMNYTDLWEDGVIVMELNYFNSSEAFDGVTGVRVPNSPNASKEAFDPTGRNTTTSNLPNNNNSTDPNNSNNNTTPDPNPSNEPASRLLRIIQSTPGVPLGPDPNFFKKLNLPPVWKPSIPLTGISEIFSAVIKLLINLLQIFLIFVRPFQEKLRNR